MADESSTTLRLRGAALFATRFLPLVFVSTGSEPESSDEDEDEDFGFALRVFGVSFPVVFLPRGLRYLWTASGASACMTDYTGVRTESKCG